MRVFKFCCVYLTTAIAQLLQRIIQEKNLWGPKDYNEGNQCKVEVCFNYSVGKYRKPIEWLALTDGYLEENTEYLALSKQDSNVIMSQNTQTLVGAFYYSWEKELGIRTEYWNHLAIYHFSILFLKHCNGEPC